MGGGVTHLCCLLRRRMLAKLFKLLLNRLLLCQPGVIDSPTCSAVGSQVGKTLCAASTTLARLAGLPSSCFWDIFWGEGRGRLCVRATFLETWKIENINKKMKVFTVTGVENVAKESDINSRAEGKKKMFVLRSRMTLKVHGFDNLCVRLWRRDTNNTEAAADGDKHRTNMKVVLNGRQQQNAAV